MSDTQSFEGGTFYLGSCWSTLLTLLSAGVDEDADDEEMDPDELGDVLHDAQSDLSVLKPFVSLLCVI